MSLVQTVNIVFVVVLSRATQAKWMRLYQHTSRCPVALRRFLHSNPAYWCFIPQRWNASMTAHFTSFGEPTQHPDEVTRLVRLGVIDDQRVADYLAHVPVPPTAYVFSYQQRQQQRFFFKEWLSRTDDDDAHRTLSTSHGSVYLRHHRRSYVSNKSSSFFFICVFFFFPFPFASARVCIETRPIRA